MGHKFNHKYPYQEERDLTLMERQNATLSSVDGERGHEPSSARNAALEGGKGEETNSTLEH